jgi:hypothetical protein
MRHHMNEPITVADLCAELRIRRTLQYSFRTCST